MRTQGSLRLILNTKLWAQMQMDKASEKSIRITATDAEDQGVKVFLISVSSREGMGGILVLHWSLCCCQQWADENTDLPWVVPDSHVYTTLPFSATHHMQREGW